MDSVRDTRAKTNDIRINVLYSFFRISYDVFLDIDQPLLDQANAQRIDLAAVISPPESVNTCQVD